MSSKVRTITGMLLLAVILAGAYIAYNKLSLMNQPDITVPGAGKTGQANNSTSGETITDISGNNENTDTTDNSDTGAPGKNEDMQSGDEKQQSEEQKYKAFDFTVYDSEGKEVNLSDFFGKPIIINFWATWCPYCIQEMPLFEQGFSKYKDDIHFMMVQSIDGIKDTKEKGEKFINDNGYTFPVYFDLDLDATATYQAYSLPTTVFIDRDGYLKAYHRGMLTEELFQKGIDLLLE
ncbi:TlpA family protein disulfide reductase [Thermoclostridium stercorarium]|uniref:TlpA family protein disulfide reductase n=1 Tax=Thermoclostridium stercorarium TaxID=1510 RepID=UPI0022496C44|nr:TlpA disulfide reductase family protein [Thermoclostridium stercorarium]UZQ85235.1 TlpA family protein disulfide reductase [Thermoclostridium stercorarium]